MEHKFIYLLKPILSLLLFVFYLFLWAIPVGFLTQLPLFKFQEGSLPSLFFSEISLTFMAIGALFMIFQTYPTRNFEHVFVVKNNLLPGFLKGTGIGLALILACTGLMFINGNVDFFYTKFEVSSILSYLMFFIFVGISEEFVFRTFPLVVFAERYKIWVSIFLNGLLFGLIHISNPNFSVFAMINITLCGIVFALITLQKRNIWWSVGMHFGWNFCQGTLLGFKVSGIDAPGLVVSRPVGNATFSGGNFGIEGSVICTFILVLYLVWLIRKQKVEPVEEVFVEFEIRREV
ncbi:type II CAAX endopeptidase family protein [Pedobacter aquatilis]|uniref:CPBP family intramembrane glutamic endopeptidase n=1 Tax=Pedobacter aquatilis TaxID=351343 RepID=UPI0029304E84|nr:type II CAAX endopeptidase family protein [Pedobacter aquatilis]